METPASHREVELEESRTEVVGQDSETLSEAVRMLLDFIADEAVRQTVTGTKDPTGDAARDAADGDVPGGPHERRPHR